MSGISFVKFIRDEKDFVVVAKPSKIAVHPSEMCWDRRTLLSMVRNKCGGQHVYPVHRLDRPVSGPILFAKTPEMAKTLQSQFEEGKVSKAYVALVRGYCDETGKIDSPLKKHNGNMQECITTYTCLGKAVIKEPFDRYDSVRYSMLQCTPVTGRFHQLRRHFRDISHPIIGDTSHGDSRQNRFFKERYGVQRLMLHCYHLGFDHPHTGERLHINMEPDGEMKSLYEALGFLDVLTELIRSPMNDNGVKPI
jgi:tRNA pseudouridine65 synthase